MKKNKFILGAGLAVLLFTGVSCGDDFLTPKITDQQTTDSFYETENQMEQGILGIYANLRNVSTYRWLLGELRSDNVWQTIYDNAQRDYIDVGTFATEGGVSMRGAFSRPWNDLYKMISNINIYLSKIDAVEFTNEDIKKQFAGEAYFMRAFAYYELVRYFGNIPIVLEVISQEEALETPQSPANEVYTQAIIPDLLLAIANLPEKPTNIRGTAVEGKANKIAAQALLGQVYMTMSGYPLNIDKKAEAKTLFEAVMKYAEDNNKHWASTGTDWQKMWLNEQDNKYHIFEIQYINGADQGSPMVFEVSPGLWAGYTTATISGNGIWADSTLLEALTEYDIPDQPAKDIRYLATVDTTHFKNLNATPVTTYSGDPFFIKFLEHNYKRASWGLSNVVPANNYAWPLNFPLIRLEDVMLMYAEIVGPTTEGLKALNDIRTRAGIPAVASATADEFTQFVRQERKRELAGEGIRWHDLVRWNIWQEVNDEKFARRLIANPSSESQVTSNARINAIINRINTIPGLYLYPIPEGQLQAKLGLYTQNAGYE